MMCKVRPFSGPWFFPLICWSSNQQSQFINFAAIFKDLQTSCANLKEVLQASELGALRVSLGAVSDCRQEQQQVDLQYDRQAAELKALQTNLAAVTKTLNIKQSKIR